MKSLIALLLLSIACSVSADVPKQLDLVSNYTEKLEGYLQAGNNKALQYDLGENSGIRSCVNDLGGLRDEIKTLRPAILDLNSFSYRTGLLIAADAAFSCVFCSDRSSVSESCNALEQELKTIKGQLKQDLTSL